MDYRTNLEKSGKVLVCGAGGFIGSHLVKRLKKEGFWVRGADKLESNKVHPPSHKATEGHGKVIKLPVINKNVMQIPDENHLTGNGYANSWIIDPNEVCSSSL